MPDGAAAGSLRARLALAFVAVAVTAVAAIAAVVFSRPAARPSA